MKELRVHRAKTYAFKLDNNDEVKKAKGTKRRVIQNQLTFKDYVDVLFNKVPIIKSQFGFRSRNHEIDTEKINKIALNSNDNKRIQDDNGINTYTHGYFHNNNNNNNKKVDTKSELDILREEAKALRNNSKILKKDANAIRNSSKVIREEINNIIKESQAIKENNTKSGLDILKKEIHTVKKEPHKVKKEPNTIKKEPHTKRELDILRENAKCS